MINLQLTGQQAEALLGLLDVAVKTKGLEVAEAGAFFYKLVQSSSQAAGDINAEAEMINQSLEEASHETDSGV